MGQCYFQEDWEKEKSEKLRQLEEVYVENLKNIGEGHRDAVDKVNIILMD